MYTLCVFLLLFNCEITVIVAPHFGISPLGTLTRLTTVMNVNPADSSKNVKTVHQEHLQTRNSTTGCAFQFEEICSINCSYRQNDLDSLTKFRHSYQKFIRSNFAPLCLKFKTSVHA